MKEIPANLTGHFYLKKDGPFLKFQVERCAQARILSQLKIKGDLKKNYFLIMKKI